MYVHVSGQCRGNRNAVVLAGLVTTEHKPFVTQRQLQSKLNEAYPTVWLEVCKSVCVFQYEYEMFVYVGACRCNDTCEHHTQNAFKTYTNRKPRLTKRGLM